MLKVRFVNDNARITTDAVLQMVQDQDPNGVTRWRKPVSHMTWEDFRLWNEGKATFRKQVVEQYKGGYRHTYRIVLQ